MQNHFQFAFENVCVCNVYGTVIRYLNELTKITMNKTFHEKCVCARVCMWTTVTVILDFCVFFQFVIVLIEEIKSSAQYNFIRPIF